MVKLPKTYSQKAAAALLRQHGCDVPFHVVRMRFLGNIATPGPMVKPLDMVQSLWGGALPAVDSMDTLNAIFEMLIGGLWNDLVRHQKRSAPVRLTRLDVPATPEGLSTLAEVRIEELDAFADGLLGPDDDIDELLSERADQAINELAEVRALFYGTHELVTSGRDKDADAPELARTLQNLMALTKITETEIHEAVMACAKARRARG